MGIVSRLKSMFLGRDGDGAPQTGGYRVPPFGYYYTSGVKRPLFTLWTADAMLYDPQVHFGLAIGNGPLLSAEVEVESDSEDVAEFVREQWRKIWSGFAPMIVKTKNYGFAGFEVCYEQCGEAIEFKSLRDFHPRDVRPVSVKGRPWGVNVYGQRVQVTTQPEPDQSPAKLRGPKGLWLTYASEHGSQFGRSLLERAYAPWWDKAMDGGALDLRRLRNVKDAWIGDQLHVPFSKATIDSSGNTISWRDLGRELAETRASGGILVLPSESDPVTGKPLVEYKPPTSVTGTTDITPWVHDLDADIFDGLLVPKEVVEAAATGSGFSGRSIPLMMFLSVRDTEFSDYVRQIDQQIIRQLVWARWGENAAKSYEIKPTPLLETIGKQTQGSAVGGQAVQGPEQQPQGQGPMQFAATEDTAKGQWITIGANDHKGGTPVRVHRGQIVSGPSALKGKKMGDIGAEKHDADSRLDVSLRTTAAKHGVSKSTLRSVAGELYREKVDAINERESAKKRLREIMGLNSGDIGRLENSGRDLASVKGFDDAARQAANELPELGIGGDDYDPSVVWDILREGRQQPPSKHDPKLLAEAAEYIKKHRRMKSAVEESDDPWGDPFEDNNSGAVPFAIADDPQSADTDADKITKQAASGGAVLHREIRARLSKLLSKKNDSPNQS